MGLVQGYRRRWFGSEASAVPEPAATGESAELVEVPLAQTGEGIAECELLRWFVSEVSALLLCFCSELCFGKFSQR